MLFIILMEKKVLVFAAHEPAYLKAIHKLVEIEKVFKVLQEICDSNYVELDTIIRKILTYWTD